MPRIVLSTAHLGLGLLGIGFCLPYVIAALSVEEGENPSVFGFGVYLFAPLLTIYFLPSLICGAALLFNRNWAASILRIQAFAYALAIPIGTLLEIATWVVLAPIANRGQLSQADARALAANRSRRDFLFVVIAVASGFALLLKWLLSYHGSQSPSAVDAVFPISAIAFGTCGIYFVPSLTARFRSRRRGAWTPMPLPSASATPTYEVSCEQSNPSCARCGIPGLPAVPAALGRSKQNAGLILRNSRNSLLLPIRSFLQPSLSTNGASMKLQMSYTAASTELL